VTSPGDGRFATTHWSLVLVAGTDIRSVAADEALTTLCETYWYPLYAFLRKRGHSAEDAQDLTQAFFVRVLEKHDLRHADPARGRFRSFLLASLKNFVANERDRDIAKKRGGGVAIVSLEFESAEGRFQMDPPTDDTPERVFDRQWAMTLLERAMARLEAEMADGGKKDQFDALKIFLTGDTPKPAYASIGRELGMSDGAIKVAVHRLRRRFRDLVHDQIAQTVSTPEEIEDELRYLWSAVRA
jgi:RNA polymerase sigma factor (sigma-70 family)